MPSPTQRFSDRAENYAKYRPGYPSGTIKTLVKECGLTETSFIADIGSGTGILSESFLKHGNQVFGIEPNREMRGAGERFLNMYRHFTSVEGTAEATTLANHSVDFVTAGQSFHWFDRSKTRAEFARILKPDGWVVLIWNERVVESSAFGRAYEALITKYGTDYEVVRHTHLRSEDIGAFFSPRPFVLRQFESQQALDFDGIKGRLLSSSYAPEPGHPKHQPMLDELRALFDKHQTGGRVDFDYITMMYFGQLT
jgi:SAM-dependent methyltransferase